MNQDLFTIVSNERLTSNVFKMVLDGNTASLTKPGQFVNIKLDGFFLRRPISVCDYTDGRMMLVYKVVGDGTKLMSQMSAGEKLDILSGLGNGFDTLKSGEKPLLTGGGVGIPPMYNLCKKLLSESKKPSVILGFNTESEAFLIKEFCELSVPIYITTVDGSRGIKGFVTDAMKDIDYSYFYACGPMPMFEAIEKTAVTSGQFSFEERMGCGFGACMGCSCKTKYGNKRICKDGPVLEREEVIW